MRIFWAEMAANAKALRKLCVVFKEQQGAEWGRDAWGDEGREVELKGRELGGFWD